ncbi:MAG: type 2 isopentenyl-diphosphate Delta-isomerase [Candidatus Altiarchaeia archaeon]
MKIKDRKLDHLRICIEENVESGKTGLDDISLIHKALPEIDFNVIDTSVKFLGKTLKYPIIFEAMTGGVDEASRINKDVASVAQEYGLGFGVGSQRAGIEDSALEETFRVRDVAPDVLLIANIGAVQLNYGYGVKECEKAVRMIGADALALHLNPLQEAVQPEGNRDFSGLTKKINDVSKKLSCPVIAKETGCGISGDTARALNVSAFDVAGFGGTSWSLVESHRSAGVEKEIGKTFSSWGIPTAQSIMEVVPTGKPVIASGGIRTGIDAAKSLALGAQCVGMAQPILTAWSVDGKKGVRDFLDVFIYELKICMFLTGSRNAKELRGKTFERH